MIRSYLKNSVYPFTFFFFFFFFQSVKFHNLVFCQYIDIQAKEIALKVTVLGIGMHSMAGHTQRANPEHPESAPAPSKGSERAAGDRQAANRCSSVP